MSGAMASSTPQEYERTGQDPYRLDGVSAGTRTVSAYAGVDGSHVERTPSPEERKSSGVERQQEQSFLGPQPTVRQEPPADPGVVASDWVVPVAAGVGVGGIAAAAAARGPADHEQREIAMPPDEEKPEVPEKSSLRSSQPSESSGAVTYATSTQQQTEANVLGAAAVTSANTEDATTATTTTTTTTEEPTELGGLESEGAHETGSFFPRVIRHDTDMSISHLHVPGKFPKQS